MNSWLGSCCRSDGCLLPRVRANAAISSVRINKQIVRANLSMGLSRLIDVIGGLGGTADACA